VELSAKFVWRAGSEPGDMAPRVEPVGQTDPAESLNGRARPKIRERMVLGPSSPERNARERIIRLRKANVSNAMGVRFSTMSGANSGFLAAAVFVSRAPVLWVRTGPGKS